MKKRSFIILGFGLFLTLSFQVGGLVSRCQAAIRPDVGASAGIAVIDSLLAIDQTAEAVLKAKNLVAHYGDDPLYGWQVKGRLGLALIRSGKMEESIGPLQDAIGKHPREAVLHRNLAYALKTLGRRGRAFAEYETVVQLTPADPSAHLEYGQFLLDFKDYRGAERELKLAAGLCGNCLDAERALANLFVASHQEQKAVIHLARVWAADPGPRARLLYASALVRAGQDSTAQALLDSKDPEKLQLEEWRILIQIEKNSPQLGSRWSLAAVARLKIGGAGSMALPSGLADDAKFWAIAASNVQRAGKLDEALLAWNKALALQPDNVLFHRNKTTLLLDLGRESAARLEWEEVLRLDPSQKATQGRSP